jgi:TRAP-type transport system periplasmic protein
MKQYLFICLLTALSLGFAFAGGGGEAATTDPSEQIDIEFASFFPTEHTIHLGLERAKETLHERSSGRINLIIYPNGTYSTQVNAIAAIKMGALDMGTWQPLADAYPPAGVLIGPYVFSGYDHWRRFRTSELANEMLRNAGSAFGAVWLENSMFQFGFRNVASKIRAETPSDFESIRLRVVDVPPYEEAAPALNARGTPVPITEVYMALRTGVVDATENPLPQIYTMKFHEPTDYLIMTRHMLSPGAFVISMRKWNTLSPDDQELLTEVFSDVATWIDEQAEIADDQYLEILRQEGMTVIEPDVTPFVDRAPSIVEKYPQWEYYFNGIREMMD